MGQRSGALLERIRSQSYSFHLTDVYKLDLGQTKRKNILFQGENPVAFLFTAWLKCGELQCPWFVFKTECTEYIEVLNIL